MAKPNRKLPELTPQDVERFWSKVDKTPGHGPNGDCWMWTACTSGRGYGVFQVKRNGQTAHRVSYFLSTGTDPSNLFVCHRCDNKICVNPNHLFLGTHEDNMRDGVAKGRFPKGSQSPIRLHPEIVKHGELSPRAKLTNKQAKEIRKRLKRGERQWRVAEVYGVSLITVSRIARHISYKHA